MKTASWVIVNLETGDAVFETFNPAKVAALNTVKYKAVPILEWLQHLSRKYKSQNQWPSVQIL
jgi:hypothetical protein